jgi:hypothetical protein
MVQVQRRLVQLLTVPDLIVPPIFVNLSH